jgi:hypothetical protein
MTPEEKQGVLADRWQPVFRHSAGRLGSRYLTAIRSEKRLLAWKTKQPARLSAPPKDFGSDGEWIEIGPGAVLLSYAPAEWVADSGEDVLRSFVLGRVLVDGAESPSLALLKLGDGHGEPERGARLIARFASEAPAPQGADFWFEPLRGASSAAGAA